MIAPTKNSQVQANGRGDRRWEATELLLNVIISKQGGYHQDQANFSGVCRLAATERRSKETAKANVFRARQPPGIADNGAE